MNAAIRNVGRLDRTLRVVLGIGLLAIAGPERMWAFIGVLPLATGLAGRCPLYTLFGIDSLPRVHRRPPTP